MCTIGAMRFGDGSYALFKNKDFGRPSFDDQIVLEPSVFGVSGLVTWTGDDPSLDEFSGFSIGANAHGLLCCDANVKMVPDHANYDDLVEIALRSSTDFVGAIEAVADAVARRPHHWGNLVLIDGDLSGAIEVRGNRIEVVVNDGSTVRTNHHIALGATEYDDNTTTSQPRLEAAQRLIDDADTVGDLYDLMCSHDDGAGAICVHGEHQTVYGYLLHHDRSGVALTVTQGSPCQTARPVNLTLPIGNSWSTSAADRFRRAYPSARSKTPT
ncbi:MAG: hypothetical protein U9N78_11705 [Actinomycetota bacterium]|nr:hypothetical protein [Actinomycetota bacterium]